MADDAVVDIKSFGPVVAFGSGASFSGLCPKFPKAGSRKGPGAYLDNVAYLGSTSQPPLAPNNAV